MRTDPGFRGDVRSSALWGRRGESRSSALWGRGGRGAVTLLALALVFVIPIAGSAAPGPGKDGQGAVVPNSLLAAATADPLKSFHVIVQGRRGFGSASVAKDVASENGNSKKEFDSINGVSADVSGKDLLKLARHP